MTGEVPAGLQSESENLMLAEIREQPGAVARCLDRNEQTAKAFAEHIRSRGVRYAIIAARGTSDNAAIYAKYLFETNVGLPVALAAPSVLTLYETKLELHDALVIGVSQSGQGTDIVEVLRDAREGGALTLAVTNFADSPLAENADEVLLCHAGLERSVAATKTYTTTLAALAMLVAPLTQDDALERELKGVPDHIAGVLMTDDEIRAVSERYRYMTDCISVARGLNQCTAMEAALKLAETCYLVTHAYSGADLQHGPIAVVDRGFPCLVFNPEGRAHQQLLDLTAQLTERGAECLVFANDDAALRSGERGIRLPVNVPERVSPISYIVAAQLFAFHLARHRGFDPDHPRGLKKVTRTR